MKNERKNSLTKVAAIVTILALTFLLAGCKRGKDNVEESPVVEPEVTAEVTDTPEVPDEPTVEPSTETEETPIEEMTVEEWIKSLELDRPAFFIINENTGAKELLVEGEEYTVSKEDIFVRWKPSDWKISNTIITSLYIFDADTSESKYGGRFYHFNYDEIGEKDEVTQIFIDPDGNEVPVTVYITKEASTTE